MEYKVQGRLKVINETVNFDSGFQKREFVVTTQEQYPQDIKLDFIKDNCLILNDYSVGQEVEVSFNLRGNEYKEKYYVNLQAWKIKAKAGNEVKEESKIPPLAPPMAAPISEGDDLPF